MKYTLLFLSILMGISAFGQNYQPFATENSKRFQNTQDENDNLYYFYSVNDTILGDSLVWDQYFYTRRKTAEDPDPENIDSCEPWGISAAYLLDTTWLGTQVIYDTKDFVLILQNQSSNELVFDFGIEPGDSHVFFQNDSVEYLMVNQGKQWDTIFEKQDSVLVFELASLKNGEPDDAFSLHGFKIKLSENHGLISFLDTYHFPQVQTGVTLRGQTTPPLGNYHTLLSDVYPYQAGDKLQFIHTYKHYIIYERLLVNHLVTNRIETADSIVIHFENQIDTLNGYTSGPGPETRHVQIPDSLKFHKNELLLDFPINYTHYIQKELSFSEHIKLRNYLPRSFLLYTYFDNIMTYKDGFDQESSSTKTSMYAETDKYCEIANCYASFDGYQIMLPKFTYVKGRGKTREDWQEYGPPENAIYYSSRMNYSLIDGEEFGEWIITGKEKVASVRKASIFPNPSNGNFQIQSALPIQKVEVRDISGRVIFSSSETNDLMFQHLTSGNYFLNISFENQEQETHRLIIRP